MAECANRLGLDLKIYSYADDGSYSDDTLLYTIDFANEVSYELTSEITWATGGKTHANKVGFRDPIEGTLTISTQIVTDTVRALASGMDISKYTEGSVVEFLNDSSSVIPTSYIIVGNTLWQDVNGVAHTEMNIFYKATIAPKLSGTYTGEGDPQEIELEFELGTNANDKVYATISDSDTFESADTETEGGETEGGETEGGEEQGG